MSIKTIVSGILRKRHRAVNCLAGAFRRIEKKVVFESFRGRQYSDNPRAVSEKLHELYPDYRIVWGLPAGGARGTAPDYVRAVPADSPEYRRERATAFAYVRNEAMTGDLYKRKGQVFIQTWHGDRGIKKILYDSLEARGMRADDGLYTDGRVTDLFVVGSEYAAKRIRTAFRYNGPVMASGCPRNDCLLNPRGGDAVRERIGILPGQKVLLYAPTLRRNQDTVKCNIDIADTLSHFAARGGEWVCLVRAHPKSLGLTLEPGAAVIDVSAWPDMSDLLMIADALITDYSSCAGDFALRRKPLLLAQFDLEQYMKEDRTFHVDIGRIGYLTARDQAELDRMIDTMTDEQFAENCEQVLKFFGTHETGHAAEDVCRWIDAQYRERTAKRQKKGKD